MQQTVSNIEFHQGLPSATYLDTWSSQQDGQLLVLDDLMTEVCRSAEMVALYTIKCHHKFISTVTLQHSLYPPGKYSRTLSLNVNYFILFKNQKDELQVQFFGKQIFPKRLDYFMDSYTHATTPPFGYLVVDLHPQSDKKYKLRTCILEGETPIIYMPKA